MSQRSDRSEGKSAFAFEVNFIPIDEGFPVRYSIDSPKSLANK
ncbi:MAG TPA: hypothetical protein PKY82_01660 [Pyrinomonadaceae bacterium]|nr:hypothetical protein [Pyrinomonadaceae bacterium]